MKNIWAGRTDRVISFTDLLTGVRFAGLDWDRTDLENSMVSMFEQKMVLGYVSHGTGVILANKINPFPNVSVKLEAIE
jgi:hypothetical protein